MKEKLSFLAIDPYQVVNYKEPKEKELGGTIMSWGDKNDYPDYLLSLYNDVGILRTIINGCLDYTVGNGIEGPEWALDLLPKLILDYWIYGGFSFQVIRNKLREPSKYVYLDFRNVRVSKDGNEYYYSEDWSKTWGRCKYVVYPKYDKDDENQPTGIVYFKNVFNQYYPTPVYGAKTTIQACELEKDVSTYHSRAIQNGFVGGYAFDFQSGLPDPEERKQIEKDILEKYAGPGNAERIVINFSEDKDHGLNLTRLETNDFGEKYKSLTKKATQELFTAFRATPNLFGISSENNGFNSEEYESTFKLFNRTMIRPAQIRFVDLFRSLGEEVKFIPFSWD